MKSRQIAADITSFDLPLSTDSGAATVAIPTSKGLQQKFFFLNLKTGKGLKIACPRRGGLSTLEAWAFIYHFCTFVKGRNGIAFPRLRTLFQRYHNGVSIFEILFKLSKPHGITHIGDSTYLVSFWSSSTFWVIDLKLKSVRALTLSEGNGLPGGISRIRRLLAEKKRQEIFSTYQYFDTKHKETYFATQLRDRGKHSAYYKKGANFDVPTAINTFNWESRKRTEVWRGNFGEAMHYIAVSQNRRYLGLVQFGDYFDNDKQLLPSKILILDLHTQKEWWIDNSEWSPSAHIDWDPVEPNVCYLSCHNGVIVPVDNRFKFLIQKVYKWNIYGPASLHKYEITEDGPRKIGVFTHPEMFRMTIHKVFMHRQRKLIACTGFPNVVFIADADTLELIRMIHLQEASGVDSVLGSLYPSPDGETIHTITTRSFQMIHVASGQVILKYNLGNVYDPFNHMTCVKDTNW